MLKSLPLSPHSLILNTQKHNLEAKTLAAIFSRALSVWELLYPAGDAHQFRRSGKY